VLVGLVVIMATVMLLLFLYFRQFRLRIKKEHLQSEVDFLKAQLNPHFLFNSINNIYVLLDENKEKASIILLKFSELMRYQLYECNVSLIHLSKELQFLENYTEFEKLRYSNKISVSYELSGTGSGNLLIAPLLLQPFIENAFKHTPKSRNSQSHIAVRIFISGNTLVFDVSNSRDATKASSLPGGIGLENVKKRLKLLYPGRHELSTKATNNLYHIILKLTLAHD
jgi:LytS/YehU family sensor histidine kinase